MRLFGFLRRRRHEPRAAPAPRSDSELHRRRAETEAEVEDRDIDEMLGAIAERRRRTGRREIGEEMEDELRSGTWE